MDAPAVGAERRPDYDRLFDLASEQQGFFTARQAHDYGYSPTLLSHHARRGRFVREARGLYRLRHYPSSLRPDVITAWLHVGRDVAVVSHESALDLLDLSDVVPGSVHLTVPRALRSLRPRPGVTLHTRMHPPQGRDVTEVDGIKVTSPIRTLLDSAEWGSGPEQIELAITQVVSRGLASPGELREAALTRSRRVQRLVSEVLDDLSA